MRRAHVAQRMGRALTAAPQVSGMVGADFVPKVAAAQYIYMGRTINVADPYT
jgi:hypothetical protein